MASRIAAPVIWGRRSPGPALGLNSDVVIRNQTAADEYREIAGRFTALVEGVPDDATWNRRSPVPEWTARDVVRHLVEWIPGFLAAGAGVTFPQGPAVDDDPVAAWRVMSDGVQAVLDDPAAADRKLANPHIITRGMVFLGKGVEIQSTPELATMEIGRWVHIGDKNTIRCHEGSLRFGDKVVLGRDNVINTYLDIELGDSVLMADWVYVCDFDHRMDDINVPIKDQGIIKGPVRIGPDTWIATKVTILRNTTIGRGCVLGSHAVVKGDVPDFSIAVGAPAKVVKNRQLAWETSAAQRAELAAALADIERKKANR